jgi:hypothetical protein
MANAANLSKATVLYLGYGRAAAPQQDKAGVAEAFGAQEGPRYWLRSSLF